MRELAALLWSALDGDLPALESLTLQDDGTALPSVFDVTGLATASIGVATLAAAELLAARNGGTTADAGVSARAASAAFVCERLFEPIGWTTAPLWDPIAGDYRALDGWIRLHTNYASHRAAALRALGLREPDRAEVSAVVQRWRAADLEQRVVDEGGCAAVMHTADEWSALPHGAATRAEPPVAIGTATPRDDVARGRLQSTDRPLEGIRVLDLTRVIAGPVCTRFLAAWGAEVLRVDPPGFEEVPALVPETSAGKRCASIDLRSEAGRARFTGLLAQTDVVVHGLRPGALAGLGLDADAVRRANPGCVVAALDAYGWVGPWAGRRGFDSLVQMSCGIAAAGAAAAGVDEPTPLPAQALDHATGYLLAGAITRALTTRHRRGRVVDVAASLIGTANLLMRHKSRNDVSARPPEWTTADTEERATEWGPARAVPIPGRIAELHPELRVPAGPLGRHEPAFAPLP